MFKYLKNLGNLFFRHIENPKAKAHEVTISEKDTEEILNAIRIMASEGNYKKALSELESIKDKLSGNPLVPFYQGNVYQLMGNKEGALTSYEQALSLDVENLSILKILISLENSPSKLIPYARKIIEIEPKNYLVRSFLAANYAKINKHDQAESYYLAALDIEPQHAESLHNLGFIYLESGKLDLAKKYLLLAIEANRNFPEAFMNLGCTYKAGKEYHQAIIQIEQAISLQPENTRYLSEYADALRYACEWEKLDDVLKNLILLTEKEVREYSKIGVSPFMGLTLFRDLEMQVKITKAYSSAFSTKSKKATEHKKHEKINLAYISPDFNQHAVGMLLSDILVHHDKKKFNIHCYYLRKVEDQFTHRIKKSCDSFISLVGFSDAEAADKIEQDDIDILVDLAGYTKYSRPQIMALRPARLQCHALGYPSTMAADFIDYFISHKTIVSRELRPFFQENIIYLPDVTIATNKFIMPTLLPSRSELGLPDNVFIFAYLNATYRIDDTVFSCWMEILESVPDSILWLSADDDRTRSTILGRVVDAGIDPERIIFTDSELLSARWKHHVVDLWLDTFYLTAGTATYLCQWAGVPVLTMAGGAPQSRTGAMAVSAAAGSFLVVHSPEEYVSRAVEIASDSELMRGIREKLVSAREDSPLYQPGQYIKNLEHGFLEIWNNYIENNSPIDVHLEK